MPEEPPEPEPVKVRLYVTSATADGALGTRMSRAADEDETDEDETSAGIVPSTAVVTEGGHFRLMVRFDGTTPLNGTCTIGLVDSGGHDMADVTAQANGFDASSGLIHVVDDDPVTDDRTITATLRSCDLPDIESYEIAEPNTAVVLVRDDDPAAGIGGVSLPPVTPPPVTPPPATPPPATPPPPTPPPPTPPPPTPPPPAQPAWTPVSASATLSAGSTFTTCWALRVNVSPGLPQLPASGASYSIEINYTVRFPDGRANEYGIIRQAFLSGSGVSRSICAFSSWPDGTSVRASLDAFHEIYPTTGVAQFVSGNRYGSYSVGSPSAATATKVAER